MILRLIVAFARWTWGISPAFVSPDRINEDYVILMVMGTLIDIAVFSVLSIVAWYNWGKKEGGEK